MKNLEWTKMKIDTQELELIRGKNEEFVGKERKIPRQIDV